MHHADYKWHNALLTFLESTLFFTLGMPLRRGRAYTLGYGPWFHECPLLKALPYMWSQTNMHVCITPKYHPGWIDQCYRIQQGDINTFCKKVWAHLVFAFPFTQKHVDFKARLKHVNFVDTNLDGSWTSFMSTLDVWRYPHDAMAKIESQHYKGVVET